MSNTTRPSSPLTPRRRTVLGGLAASVALTGGLAACGGRNASSKEGELRILVLKHSLTKPMADMAWTAALEEAAGIPIVWEEVSADWDQKKSTMLAAGDIPDLIVGTNAITCASRRKSSARIRISAGSRITSNGTTCTGAAYSIVRTSGVRHRCQDLVVSSSKFRE